MFYPKFFIKGLSILIGLMGLFVSVSFAETILLKNGVTIHGDILERNEKTVRVKTSVGLDIIYDVGQIESINAVSVEPYKVTAPKENSAQTIPAQPAGDFSSVVQTKKNFVMAPADIEAAEAAEIKARQYLDAQQFDLAIGEFTKIIQKNIQNPIAFYNRGNAYMMKKDFPSAIADYSQALILDPHDAPSYGNRAVAYQNNGQIEKAVEDFNKSLELDPSLEKSYFGLGYIADQKKDVESALSNFTKALNLDPNDAKAREYQADLYIEKNDLDAALADFNYLIDHNQASAKTYYGRGYVSYKKDATQQAIVDLTKAIDLEPKGEYYYARAGAYYNQQDLNRSKEDFKKASELGVAVDKKFLGNLEKANEMVAKALKKNLKYPQ